MHSSRQRQRDANVDTAKCSGDVNMGGDLKMWAQGGCVVVSGKAAGGCNDHPARPMKPRRIRSGSHVVTAAQPAKRGIHAGIYAAWPWHARPVVARIL